MKCQLILTIWIVCLFFQVHNKPLSDLVSNKASDPNTPNVGNSDPATDQSEYEDSYEPAEDRGEYLDDAEDTGQNPPSDDAESEHPEKPTTEKSPKTLEAQATAPEVAKEAKEVAPSDEKLPSDLAKKPEEKNPSSNKNEPEEKNLKDSKKRSSPKAVNEPRKAGNMPLQAAESSTPELPERRKQPEERLPPDQKAEKKVQKAPSKKGEAANEVKKAKVNSPKQSKGEPSDKRPEKKGTASPKPNQQNVKRQGETPAEKSKWQKARDTMLISSNPKNNSQQRSAKDNTDRKQPRQNKRETSSPTATAPVDENVTEFVGSISDLLSSIGRRMDSFEDVNKKPRPIEGRQLRRDVGVSARSVAPQLGTKSLPVDEEREPSRGRYYDSDERSSFSSQISPFQMAKRKEAEKLQKLYGTKRDLPSSPPSETPAREKKAAKSGVKSGVAPKSINAARSLGSSTAKSGTEDYEKFIARRARLLDELEAPQPINQAARSLPKRLTNVSGTFESIASQLNNNIKSVSAVNKDATSKLASKSPTKINARGPNDDLIDEEDEDTGVTGRGDGKPCPCYNKYSPLNVVRRTAKRVVRVIRNGTNAVYDGVDSGIVKAKDIKDAMKNDLIDPAVQMIPVVSPIVAGVVDAGDAAADGAVSMARGAVQGGRGLNDGLYEGVEKMLKKDKTCVC